MRRHTVSSKVWEEKAIFLVGSLGHGGIIANYKCTAACRHCLYACSPKRSGSYITVETAKDVCNLLLKAGCRSVHIGGGEPFLDFEGLLGLVRVVTGAGMHVEYIETNAFWATDDAVISKRLTALSRVGADALCISLDPFHAEYVPYRLPILLAEACARQGYNYFLWQRQFYQALSKTDPGITHNRSELERLLSSRYILDTALNYGLHYGGRAVNIEEEYFPRKPLSALLDSKPCRELLSGGHFHTDLYGGYIPGCVGISIPLREVVEGIPEDKYPAFKALVQGGVAGLFDFARTLGFTPDENGYTSRCALCFHIRRWLSGQSICPELDTEYYEASMEYYD